MVKTFAIGLLCGWVCGAVPMLLVFWFTHPSRVKTAGSKRDPLDKSLPSWKLWSAFKPKPEAPKDYPVTPIPRTVGSWRKQKADLERQHNSKQKERDQRVAGL
jgi:hypothetical protein